MGGFESEDVNREASLNFSQIVKATRNQQN
jgi:hypothetical protein